MNAPQTLQIELDHFHHQPFQTISGRVIRNDHPMDKDLELRIFWFTRGRGDEEASIQHQSTISAGQSLTPFSWKLPAAPYSFAGRLITLAWAVEVVNHKEQSLELVPFLLSPTGEEIELEVIPDPPGNGRLKDRFKKLSNRKT